VTRDKDSLNVAEIKNQLGYAFRSRHEIIMTSINWT